jgi:propanediol dehydratase small subunit
MAARPGKLDAVLNGEVTAEDLRITPQTLRLQAEIADAVRRPQLAQNMRRAAELTAVPDERILEIYNALRPRASTKQQLLEIAEELENRYSASVNAAFVREAAEVYERRGCLAG